MHATVAAVVWQQLGYGRGRKAAAAHEQWQSSSEAAVAGQQRLTTVLFCVAPFVLQCPPSMINTPPFLPFSWPAAAGSFFRYYIPGEAKLDWLCHKCLADAHQ